MTAFSGSPRHLPLFLALALPLALYAGQAFATPPPGAAPAAPAAGNHVDTDELATVGIDTAGALTTANGALPVDMWRDTPRSLVDALLPRLPAGTPSPATVRLMRRLLLTGAAAPRGEAEPGRLLDERARMLWRMGDTEELLKLIAAVPADSRSEQLWQLDTEAQLLAGNTSGACQTAASRTDVDPDIFWQKMLGFCQALAGDADGASLTLALLVERGAETQPYKALLEALINGRTTGPKIADPDPLDLAMLRAIGLAPAMEAAAGDDLPILVAIAQAGTFPSPCALPPASAPSPPACCRRRRSSRSTPVRDRTSRCRTAAAAVAGRTQLQASRRSSMMRWPPSTLEATASSGR